MTLSTLEGQHQPGMPLIDLQDSHPDDGLTKLSKIFVALLRAYRDSACHRMNLDYKTDRHSACKLTGSGDVRPIVYRRCTEAVRPARAAQISR